jgi:hypothetical protein
MAARPGAPRRSDISGLVVAIVSGAAAFIVVWVTLTRSERRQAAVEIGIAVMAIVIVAAVFLMYRQWASIRFARRCLREERTLVTEMQTDLTELRRDLLILGEGQKSNNDNDQYKRLNDMAGRIRASGLIERPVGWVAEAIFEGVFQMAHPAATIGTVDNALSRCQKAFAGYADLERQIGWFKR